MEQRLPFFVWDGDAIAQELNQQGTITYLYEPDSFVPLANVVSAEIYYTSSTLFPAIEIRNFSCNAEAAKPQSG